LTRQHVWRLLSSRQRSGQSSAHTRNCECLALRLY
jgi:hypothetical protein